MIQRIQTVWLLLASACAFLTIKLPFYSGLAENGMHNPLNALSGGILILILTILIGLIALINVFMFRDRVLQLRMCVLGIVLEGLLIYLYYRQVQMYMQGTYSLSSILHTAVVILFIMAGRGINKDEKIVKESNRLR